MMVRLLQSLASGLLSALLAPAIGALLMAAWIGLKSDLGAQFSAGDAPGLALALLTAAYLLGTVPAFLTGMALPLLQSKLPLPAAAMCTGALGAGVFAATFGAHLLEAARAAGAFPVSLLIAFVAGTVTASLVTRIHREA